MKKALSILIPVYNTGDYLRPCLDSILAQTLADWELILIDDGSTDESGTICDEYAAKDERIRVVHKKNEGVSVARNLGLTLAQGEYVGFVDSDDCIAPEMFGDMYQAAMARNANIVMCDAVTVYGDGREEPDTITGLEVSSWVARESWKPKLLLEMAGAVWRCIYRRDLLEEHGVKFPVGLRFSEDRVFNLYAVGYANGVEYIKSPYYKRLIREDSAVHKFYPNYFNIVKDAAAKTKQAIAEAWENDGAIQTAYQAHLVGGALAAVNNYFYKTSTYTIRERRQKIRELCEDAELRTAVCDTGFGGVRGRWICKKHVDLLCLCAQVLNWKHGR